MSKVPDLKFHDGRSIPQLGFGLWQVPADDAAKVVAEALKVGYRSIDGAAIYENESGFGKGIQQSGIPREELFITTKLWNDDQGYDKTLRAFDASLDRLGLKTLDLYLIHWPMPQKNLFVESWKAMIQLKKDGRVQSIGVSNFAIEHLKRIIDETGIVPVVNQIELHPNFQQKALREFHAKHNIATESWSPLGQGQQLSDPTIQAIAKKHQRTAAQVIIRWHLQSGLIVIPKSVTPSRIRENFDVFGFELDSKDLEQIGRLDSANGRIGPDPITADF